MNATQDTSIAFEVRQSMFERESEMTDSATQWLISQGLDVKSEFSSPWGICDLVGVKLNNERVTLRLKQNQRRTVGSLLRSRLLLDIPEASENCPVTAAWLAENHGPYIVANAIETALVHLCEHNFIIKIDNTSFAKCSGWIPLQERIVAIELKISRVEEAMRQAQNNLAFADESYVGLPHDVAHRVRQTPRRWMKFLNAGVGVLAVSKTKSEVLLPSNPPKGIQQSDIQFHCVERFWSDHVRGKKA